MLPRRMNYDAHGGKGGKTSPSSSGKGGGSSDSSKGGRSPDGDGAPRTRRGRSRSRSRKRTLEALDSAITDMRGDVGDLGMRQSRMSRQMDEVSVSLQSASDAMVSVSQGLVGVGRSLRDAAVSLQQPRWPERAFRGGPTVLRRPASALQPRAPGAVGSIGGNQSSRRPLPQARPSQGRAVKEEGGRL